jgi:hypothetical protein
MTFAPLIEYVTNNDAVCNSSSSQGICVMNGTCASYTTTLSGYSFKVNFTSDTTNYVRVPLLTFAVDSTNTTGDAVCNLMISNLEFNSSTTSYSNVVVFGGMFFEEFFGVFTNSYTSTSAMNQSSALYVSANSIYSAYIGDEVLA